MSYLQVLLCATAATSASGFYEPVDNAKARPFYKSPPHHVSEYEYHPHPEFKEEETYKPVYEPAEHVPEYKLIAHAPVPEYKPIEHVTEPVHKLPEYKVPEYAPPPLHMYKHEQSQHGYHHGQASSFQNVAYKVTQQAYREAEHKPHHSPLYS